MTEKQLFTTPFDNSTTVYWRDHLRLSAVKPKSADDALRVLPETRVTDRLGAEQWVTGGEVSRHEIENLAAHVFEVRNLTRSKGMSWTCVAGPYFGYRVLMRPSSWISRIIGRKYEFCVERNYGFGNIALWKDAEAAYNGFETRIAWFLKQELYQREWHKGR